MIGPFRGRHHFLSNYYAEALDLYGRRYPTAEHAYQCQKARDAKEALWIEDSPTPGEAKRRGRKVAMRPDWDTVRFQIMREVLKAKFAPHSQMAVLLLETGDEMLVEVNWGDRFWGQTMNADYALVGSNYLGRLLMEIRDGLREAS